MYTNTSALRFIREPKPRRERPSVSVLHDSTDVRVVLFDFPPGAAMPMVRTPSAVILRALRGEALVQTLTGEHRLTEGTSVSLAPREAYAVRSDVNRVTVLATITPGPGAR